MQDRHALELKVYRQRVKHLLYEHQDGLARLKAAGEATLKTQVCAWWGWERAGEQQARGSSGTSGGVAVSVERRDSAALCSTQGRRCQPPATNRVPLPAPVPLCARQGEAYAQQEAQLGDDKRRLKQHVREQELSSEELIKQFRWAGCMWR
jgi:hypothetical protein